MENETLIFININNITRKKLDLTMNEYCLCDMIYHLSNNPKYNWCVMSKERMANELNLSKQSIHSLINKMIKKWLIEKDDKTNFLRTTQLWYDNVIIEKKDEQSNNFTDGKESLLDSKESLLGTVKKVYSDSKESLHNNNIYNNNYNNKNIYNENFQKNSQTLSFLDKFKNEIIDNEEFIKTIKNKYSLNDENLKNIWANFCLYRTEKNENWKKEKWQKEKTFDIRRRFFTRLQNEQKFNRKQNETSYIEADYF